MTQLIHGPEAPAISLNSFFRDHEKEGVPQQEIITPELQSMQDVHTSMAVEIQDGRNVLDAFCTYCDGLLTELNEQLGTVDRLSQDYKTVSASYAKSVKEVEELDNKIVSKTSTKDQLGQDLETVLVSKQETGQQILELTLRDRNESDPSKLLEGLDGAERDEKMILLFNDLGIDYATSSPNGPSVAVQKSQAEARYAELVAEENQIEMELNAVKRSLLSMTQQKDVLLQNQASIFESLEQKKAEYDTELAKKKELQSKLKRMMGV